MTSPQAIAHAAFAALFAILSPTIAPAQAQSEAAAVRAVKQAFRSNAERPTPLAERQEALALLDGHDSPAVAKAIVAAWVVVDGEMRAAHVEAAEYAEETKKLLGKQVSLEKRTLPTAALQRYKEIQRLSNALRERLDAQRQLHIALSQRIIQLKNDDARLWLISGVLTGKQHPLPVRIAAARAVGSNALLLEELHDALKRAKRPPELISILDAVGQLAAAGKPMAERVIKLLGHKEEAVRERAALALSTVAVPEAIVPMIDLLERESGMAQQRVAAALEILTGKQLGTVVGAWRQWFAAEGAAYLSGAKPLGRGEPSVRKATAKNYYMGIPQEGKAIVYVIDASGSMKDPVSWRSPAGGNSAEARDTTRLEACKDELITALGRLERGKEFNIIWYNDLPHRYEKTMVKASGKTVKDAQAWVRKLAPASSTNIHDALQMAFGLVSRGANDEHYGTGVDTVFLLTDGSPTKPDGTLDSTDEILRAVSEWNVLQRVTLHTIGIGKKLNEPFLQQLARDNGGEFKKF